MTNSKHTDNMHNNTSFNEKPNKSNSSTAPVGDSHTMTRMHPSMKRPRAPIACYRCHHKKVRCDGVHPNCTRCHSTGVLCAYPSSRRSRNTQPTNIDPFIDNLSQLEARIRRIETDLESQRALVQTVCGNENNSALLMESRHNNTLTSRILKTEKDLQESRSIVAQLRLKGEQRAARGRRAAAAAASVASTTPGPDKNNSSSSSGKANQKHAASNTASNITSTKQRVNNKLRLNHSNIKKETFSKSMLTSPYTINTNDNTAPRPHFSMAPGNSQSPPLYFNSNNSTNSLSSPTDFINPAPTYYFPYHTDMTPICVSSPGGGQNSPFNLNTINNTHFQDWSLLNELPHTPAPDSNSNANNNGFVDPMIIAAAEHGIAPPLLSVSNYMMDEGNSIIAARARSLSHLPTTPTTPNGTNTNNSGMMLPVLQPSSSSTSTSSNTSSFDFHPMTAGIHTLYDGSYTHFMDNASDMMIEQQTLRQ